MGRRLEDRVILGITGGLMLFLATVLSLFWCFNFFSHFLGTCLVGYHTRKNKKQPVASPSHEPISIIKPLKGLEPGLKANLRSLFHIEYPNYEIIFSINQPFDEARPIVEDLMRTFSGVKSRLVVTDTVVGENPRINSLYIPYRTAAHDTILICQTNISVPRNYLSMLTAKFTKDLGLLTGICTGGRANSVGGWLEVNYLGTFLARWLNIGFFFKRPVAMGNTILFRRKELDAMGGLEALSNEIAENYAAARLYRRNKKKVVLAREPATEHLTGFSFSQFWVHHLNLGRIHKSYSLFSYLLEPMTGCFLSALFGAIAFQILFHESWIVFFFSSLALSSLQDLFLLRLEGEKVDLTNLCAWWIFESLSFPIWLVALTGTTVYWKGTQVRLGKKGKATELQEPIRNRVEPSLMSDESIFAVETREISLSLVRR